MQRIEEGLSGRLVLLTAPAGWGKSSVLAEWASRTTASVAWVGCEARHGGSTGFVRALVGAIDEIVPGFGHDLFPMLRSASPLPAEHVFRVLEDALRDHGSLLTVVLDDFHLVTDQGVVDGVYGLLDKPQPGVRFVIAGRHTPSWPLARWRAHGEVTELGVADLAFTLEETSALIGNGGSRTEIASVLRQRSEGWAAGLRLARLWLMNLDDPSHLDEVFSGNNRDVADYLAEEVVNHLPPALRDVLLSVSVLDRFSPAVVRYVTGNDDADQLVEQIERQGLFVIPLDSVREWYRFHGIFREFLLSRLRRTRPDQEAFLLHRAGEWFESAGMPVEAASCFLRAGDPEAAAQAVARVAADLLLRQGEALTLIRVAEQLPTDSLAKFPDLQRYFAWALVLVGRLDDAEALARAMERGLGPATEVERRAGMAEIASIRSRIAAYRGNDADTIAHASAALEYADPEMSWFRADALLSLGFAYRSQGMIDRACDVFGQASSVGWRTGFAHGALWGSRYQALTFVSQGRLRDAEYLIESDMERARRAGMDRSSAFAALLVGRGELHYERNDLAAAGRDLQEALQLARQVGDAKILMNVYVALALLHDAEGDYHGGREAAYRAVRVFDGSMEKAIMAWLALRHGATEEVRRWMDAYREQVGRAPSLSQGETEQIMLGRAWVGLGDAEEGAAFLRALCDEAETTGRWGRALTIRLLLARAAELKGDDAAALSYARSALDLAMREQHVRSLVDEGPEIIQLLRRAARTDDSRAVREYVSSLSPLTETPINDNRRTEMPPLIDPLTERQEAVLRLLADGLSNREIAERLYVSEGTVKAHLHQIFGKLMVRNRAEAIRAARDQGLIS